MNYAEQLAYWYLRLNGFLPLTNFVMHQEPEPNHHRTSDADIIAVRFPHVSEPTGGQPDDWDERFKCWGLHLAAETIGLIVEVKSGTWAEDDLEKHLASRHWRVCYAIRRLGMFDRQTANKVASDLCQRPTTCCGGFRIAKLVVTATSPRNGSWLHITLQDTAKFIEQRMEKYARRKTQDRLFFDGDLIQFLAWRGGNKDVLSTGSAALDNT